MSRFFLSALFALGVTAAAQAGTVVIENKNCTTLDWFQVKQWVHVNIRAADSATGTDCTHKTVTVDKGTRTAPIQLATYVDSARPQNGVCTYFHYADSASGLPPDMKGDKDNYVLCEIALGICGCGSAALD